MFTQYQNYLTSFYDQFVLFDTTQCNVIFLILIVESSQNQLGVSYTPSLQPVYSLYTVRHGFRLTSKNKINHICNFQEVNVLNLLVMWRKPSSFDPNQTACRFYRV